MYVLLLMAIIFAGITIHSIKRTKRAKYQELAFENLHFALKGQPEFAPQMPEFTPVRLRVNNVYTTVDVPTKSLKRVHYTLPR